MGIKNEATFVGKPFKIHKSYAVILKKDALKIANVEESVKAGKPIIVKISELEELHDTESESIDQKNKRPKSKKKTKNMDVKE